MKKVFIYLSVVLLGCNPDISPKHKVFVFGSFIKEMGNDYYLFSKYQQCDALQEGVAYRDTLTVDGRVYNQVYFVEILPENLQKGFKNLDMAPCSLRDVYSQKDTVRKQVSGFGERKFLVVEDVVGVQ